MLGLQDVNIEKLKEEIISNKIESEVDDNAPDRW